MKAGGLAEPCLPPPPSPALLCHPPDLLIKHTRGLPKQPAPWTPMKEPGGQSNSSCSHLPWRLRAKLRMNAATHGADLLRVTSDFPFASKPKPNQAQPAHRLPTHRTTRKTHQNLQQTNQNPDAANVIKKPAQRPDARRVSVTDASLKAKEKQHTAQTLQTQKHFHPAQQEPI